MKESNIKTTLYLVVFLLLAIIFITLIPYFCTFGKYGLSDDHQAWANFGGYMGGVLGPLFSALAFICIWLTYKAQREQIELLKNQAKVSEIQRLISNTSERIDKILEGQAVVIKPPHELGFYDEPDNIAKFETIRARTFIDVLFHLATIDPKKLKLPPELEEAILDNYFAEYKIVFAENIISFNVELKQLNWLLNEFSSAGGDNKIIDFYNRRFQRAVELVNKIDCLNEDLSEHHFDTPRVKSKAGDRFFKNHIFPKL